MQTNQSGPCTLISQTPYSPSTWNISKWTSLSQPPICSFLNETNPAFLVYRQIASFPSTYSRWKQMGTWRCMSTIYTFITAEPLNSKASKVPKIHIIFIKALANREFTKW